MEGQNPTFSFKFIYAGETVSCKVTMQDHAYDVTFDGRWMASIEYTDEWDWIQASGAILPQEIVDEIGHKIERKYK